MNMQFKRFGVVLALTAAMALTVSAQRRRIPDPGEFAYAPDSDPSVVQAKELIKQKKADEALTVLNASAEANEKNADWFATRGSIYLSKQQYKEAETDLNKAIELEPKHAYAHYYMGLTQSGLKRTDQMVKHFEMFLQLAPNAPEATRVKSLLRSI
jgi:tetratricopeptide (TPR) repeat protein